MAPALGGHGTELACTASLRAQGAPAHLGAQPRGAAGGALPPVSERLENEGLPRRNVQVRATRRCGQPRRPRRRPALARAAACNPMRALLRHALAQGAYVGVPPPALPDEEEEPEAAPPPPLPTPPPEAGGVSGSGGIGGSIGGWCGSSAAPSAAPSAAVPSGERFAALSVEDVDLMEEELPAATERALHEALEMPVFE
eukprot:scaffold57086_cov59-Phaeocystis_antarctica.AAC.4